jgi:outer membrane lipopolysaccharide assembly protein LptE/RlpB
VGAVLGVFAVSALTLSGCGNQSGLALARQACEQVQSSIVSYEAGIHTMTRSVRLRDLRRASDDLQAAEPLAAAATSADGQWNALMTTLNETGQVDEGQLISALRAQCAVANGDQSA